MFNSNRIPFWQSVDILTVPNPKKIEVDMLTHCKKIYIMVSDASSFKIFISDPSKGYSASILRRSYPGERAPSVRRALTSPLLCRTLNRKFRISPPSSPLLLPEKGGTSVIFPLQVLGVLKAIHETPGEQGKKMVSDGQESIYIISLDGEEKANSSDHRYHINKFNTSKISHFSLLPRTECTKRSLRTGSCEDGIT